MWWLLTQTIVSCVAKHWRYRLPFAMAGIGVDALANKAGKMALNDGPTLLGEGAFGKVYKDTMTVAVKKIRNFDKKEVKEVETLMSLNHKFIIKCYGHHFEDNGRTLCIVMEFADKGTFTKLITEEAPNPGSNYFKEFNIWRFLCQLSLALDYLHTLPQPILHRDLKPDNILGVTTPETGGINWKLADFGLVKLLGENAQGDFYAQTFCGTPTYMAPEVCGVFIYLDSICAGVGQLQDNCRHLVSRLHHGFSLQQRRAPFPSHAAGSGDGYGPEDEMSSFRDHQRLLQWSGRHHWEDARP